MRCADKEFSKEEGVEESSILQVMEITMRKLMEDGKIDYRDFLARADMLVASGMTVLISDYFQYYRLAAYIGRYTKKMIGISMGIESLRELFEEKYYTQLDGGILESFGRLFQNNLKLYIWLSARKVRRSFQRSRICEWHMNREIYTNISLIEAVSTSCSITMRVA